MSYGSSVGGLGTFGGFGYYGLGASYRIGTRATAVQELQEQLIRLGFQPGSTGADGRWGPRTATMLAHAARYVGYTGQPYTPAGADISRPTASITRVTVPDDLITRLRSASPAPPGTPGTNAGDDAAAPVEPEPERVTIGPHLDPEQGPRATESRYGWVPAAVIGGGVLLLGGLIAWQMAPKKKRGVAVAANRRRRRRRRA